MAHLARQRVAILLLCAGWVRTHALSDAACGIAPPWGGMTDRLMCTTNRECDSSPDYDRWAVEAAERARVAQCFRKDVGRIPGAVRALLVDGAPPETADVRGLLRAVYPSRRSDTDAKKKDRESFHAAMSPAVMLNVPGALSPAACAALRQEVNDALLRGEARDTDTVDMCPTYQWNLKPKDPNGAYAEMNRIVGANATARLWQLANRIFRTQAPRSHWRVEGFIRRYSADTRPHFKFHRDQAKVTINVALSGNFPDHKKCGGHLLGVYGGAVHVVRREEGTATVHTSKLLHGVSAMRTACARDKEKEGAMDATARYSLILFFHWQGPPKDQRRRRKKSRDPTLADPDAFSRLF